LLGIAAAAILFIRDVKIGNIGKRKKKTELILADNAI